MLHREHALPFSLTTSHGCERVGWRAQVHCSLWRENVMNKGKEVCESVLITYYTALILFIHGSAFPRQTLSS